MLARRRACLARSADKRGVFAVSHAHIFACARKPDKAAAAKRGLEGDERSFVPELLLALVLVYLCFDAKHNNSSCSFLLLSFLRRDCPRVGVGRETTVRLLCGWIPAFAGMTNCCSLARFGLRANQCFEKIAKKSLKKCRWNQALLIGQYRTYNVSSTCMALLSLTL